MLDSLSDRLGNALGDLRSSGRLSEDDINTAMREIRLALLDEDFQERMAEEGRKGVATLLICPEQTENLLLNVDGVQSRMRVVVAVLRICLH